MATIDEVRKKIGANIHAQRRKAGLTQEALAEKAELHPVYMSQVERGTKAISVEALWKISKALHVSMAVLVRGV